MHNAHIFACILISGYDSANKINSILLLLNYITIRIYQ